MGTNWKTKQNIKTCTKSTGCRNGRVQLRSLLPHFEKFCFCSIDMRIICSSCTLCKHWHFVYNTVLCWSVMIKGGGEKSIYFHIQNSHTTLISIIIKVAIGMKRREEEFKKAPVVIKQYSKICPASSVLKGELPLLYPVNFSLDLPLCLEMLLEWNMLACRIDTPILYLGKLSASQAIRTWKKTIIPEKSNQNIAFFPSVGFWK